MVETLFLCSFNITSAGLLFHYTRIPLAFNLNILFRAEMELFQRFSHAPKLHATSIDLFNLVLAG